MPARLLTALLTAALVAGCASAPPGREIVVAMYEYAFLPSVVEVGTGERIRLTVRNVGRIEHDFAPDQRGAAFGLPHFHLRPGESQSQDWTAPAKPDEIAFDCTITVPAPHKGLGMSGKVVVR